MTCSTNLPSPTQYPVPPCNLVFLHLCVCVTEQPPLPVPLAVYCPPGTEDRWQLRDDLTTQHGNVMASLCVAYFLWLVGGWFGLHHFYLGRDKQVTLSTGASLKTDGIIVLVTVGICVVVPPWRLLRTGLAAGRLAAARVCAGL